MALTCRLGRVLCRITLLHRVARHCFPHERYEAEQHKIGYLFTLQSCMSIDLLVDDVFLFVYQVFRV
jgi:hypothetical protein